MHCFGIPCVGRIPGSLLNLELRTGRAIGHGELGERHIAGQEFMRIERMRAGDLSEVDTSSQNNDRGTPGPASSTNRNRRRYSVGALRNSTAVSVPLLAIVRPISAAVILTVGMMLHVLS